jgi:hypothetical protein
VKNTRSRDAHSRTPKEGARSHNPTPPIWKVKRFLPQIFWGISIQSRGGVAGFNAKKKMFMISDRDEVLQVGEESPQKFLQADCTLYVGASLVVVKLAVVHHEHEISIKHLLGLVVISLANPLFNSRQINRFLDYLKVVLCCKIGT